MHRKCSDLSWNSYTTTKEIINDVILQENTFVKIN